MPRSRQDQSRRQLIWEAILQAAKRHHRQEEDRGMSTLIAKDAGVTKASVSEWKNLRSSPSDDTIRRLASLYGVSASELAGYAGVPGVYGAYDNLLDRAADITELIVRELLSEGSTDDFVMVMRRAHELLAQGRSDAEVRGQLLVEVSQRKRANI